MSLLGWMAALLALGGALPESAPQYVSPSGKKYYARSDDRNQVAEAESKLASDPRNLDLLLALGEAQARIGRLRESLETCRRGLALSPDHPGVALSCGQRYLALRDLDRARGELERATRLDPEMRLAWLHLAVVQYLQGHWEQSASSWRRILDRNDGYVLAIPALDWLFMTYLRAGRKEEATRLLSSVEAERELQGGASIYQTRLLFYKGVKTEPEVVSRMTDALSEATLSYGLGNWYLYHEDDAGKARKYFERALATDAWTSLGFIASELDLARLP
jgi:tetratricopeptide (TPR) repeat protein